MQLACRKRNPFKQFHLSVLSWTSPKESFVGTPSFPRARQ